VSPALAYKKKNFSRRMGKICGPGRSALKLVLLVLGTSVRAHAQLNGACDSHGACPSGFFCESVFLECSNCSRCRHNGDAVDNRCPPESCPHAPVSTREDGDAPTLRSISISPAKVNLEGGSRAAVAITLSVADDCSGFKEAKFVWSSASRSASIETSVLEPIDVQQGDRQEGWSIQVLQGSLSFQTADEAGPWHLTALSLRDHAANYRAYSFDDLSALDIERNTTVHVVIDPISDPEQPERSQNSPQAAPIQGLERLWLESFPSQVLAIAIPFLCIVSIFHMYRRLRYRRYRSALQRIHRCQPRCMGVGV